RLTGGHFTCRHQSSWASDSSRRRAIRRTRSDYSCREVRNCKRLCIRSAPQSCRAGRNRAGFHRKIPPAAATYPGPYEWLSAGIRRYGFHGINHQYCAGRAAQLLKRDLNSLKLVTCHLGNGCSLAAIHEGRSIDTTMGFTPLEGLMMGTRSGSVDPGILTYLMREHRLQAHEIDDVLNKESGLLGISCISGGMREIVESMKHGQ